MPRTTYFDTAFPKGLDFTSALGEDLAAFAFTAAHRAFCAARIRAMPAALMTGFLRTGLETATDPDLEAGADFALTAAHLALAAALILAMAEALIFRLPVLAVATGLEIVEPPVMDSSCLCKLSICSLIVAAFLNCAGVRFIRFIGQLKATPDG